jgi:hypothetical protein
LARCKRYGKLTPDTVRRKSGAGREARLSNLDDYWSGAFSDVAGWVDYNLRDFLKFLGQFQTTSSISGNIAEIGVHHGRFLIALAHLGRPGEVCLSIDVFDDQASNVDGSGAGDLDQLRSNISAYGPPSLNYVFVKADSLALTITERLEIAGRYGPFRLFSVDGGHNVTNVVNDLDFAQAALAAGGAVILDDFYNRHWPSVTEGLFRFYSLGSPRIQPFLYAHNKLFLCNIGWHQRYVAKAAEMFRQNQWFKVTRMLGADTVVV